MIRILIVEGDPDLRRDLARAVRAAGYQVECPADRGEALRALDSRRFDVAVLDVEESADLDWLASVVAAPCRPAVLASGAAPSVELALEARRRGACDFLRKPFPIESLEGALFRAAAGRTPATPHPVAPPVETRDPGFAQLLRDAEAAAGCDVTVQIVGESGTGKQRLARLVHRASPRATGPLVAVDCTALPPQCGERELFGSQSSAQGGVDEAHPGRVSQAEGGTLLLREVGEIPPALQSKLLCVLQEREFIPVGARSPRKVDVRIVATTCWDLRREVAGGRFREDLFYRLGVVVLRVPPLRERSVDIPLLARSFLERFAHEAACEPPVLDERALRPLAELPLRGNVRELQNLMRRAVMLFPGQKVDLERLLTGSARAPSPASNGETPCTLRELERRAILQSLQEHGGNRTHSSRALGISVRTLRNKIRAYGLQSV